MEHGFPRFFLDRRSTLRCVLNGPSPPHSVTNLDRVHTCLSEQESSTPLFLFAIVLLR